MAYPLGYITQLKKQNIFYISCFFVYTERRDNQRGRQGQTETVKDRQVKGQRWQQCERKRQRCRMEEKTAEDEEQRSKKGNVLMNGKIC